MVLSQGGWVSYGWRGLRRGRLFRRGSSRRRLAVVRRCDALAKSVCIKERGDLVFGGATGVLRTIANAELEVGISTQTLCIRGTVA